MRPHIEDPEEVAVNFMLSLNKAIESYRDVDDDGAHYFFATYSYESTASTSKSSINHFQTVHSPLNAKNIIEFEVPLHEDLRMNLTEVIQAGDPCAKDPRVREAIAAEIRDLARRSTFKVVVRVEIPPNASVLTARFVLANSHKSLVRCASRLDVL